MRPLLRIAHGYGNRRRRIDLAIAAQVDMIEADLRYDGREVWVRHERRFPLLPVLSGWRLSGIHKEGPWALSLGPWFLRLDRRPIRLLELLRRVRDKAGLLLDLKSGNHPPAQARSFLETVFRCLREESFAGRLDFCGNWTLLDLLRSMEPGLTVHYSVGSAAHWEAIQPRLREGVSGITIGLGLLDEGCADVLGEMGIDFYCWDVRDAAEAERAAALGASGIIADDLALLGALAGASRGPSSTAPRAGSPDSSGPTL